MLLKHAGVWTSAEFISDWHSRFHSSQCRHNPLFWKLKIVYELQNYFPSLFSKTCHDILSMSISFLMGGSGGLTLLAPGGIHKTTFALSDSEDQDSCLLHSTIYPSALCLTHPFSPFSSYGSLFFLCLSNFIFHYLSVCPCRSLMSRCLFSPPICLHSLFLLPSKPPPFFIQNQTDDPDSPH